MRVFRSIFVRSFVVVSFLCGALSLQAVNVIPDEGFTHSLNGKWSFKYIAGSQAGNAAGFVEPGTDISAWKSISVPGNWELQGLAEPQYALLLKDGLGLYRRSFTFPKTWSGRRVFLRLEGVANGFEVWINGQKVGNSSASAYNPHTFDVTQAVNAGANVIAVKVTTKPLGFEFDVNDDWSLSGIFRDVTLFSLPENHIKDLSTSTKLSADGNANFSISVATSQPAGEIRGRLVSQSGKKIGEFTISKKINGPFETTISVTKPDLWTAETPSLYRLEIELFDKGRSLQKLSKNIGLREISIVDGILKLNGRPIKMRGVNHHDIDPETGRAITKEQLRRDLLLMRKGNVNFFRTSHYPPSERLIDLANELGFYVMDEVSIGKGEEHLEKAEYRENILARVAPTINRDKNHPSVIVWSIGNENPVTTVEMDAGKLAKELDPTRPICFPKIGSYFAANYEKIPDFVDIYSPHYPSNNAINGYVTKLKRPTIFTEYAHGLGLSTDRIQDQWELMQATPHFAGGAIWLFQDQGILRRSPTAVDRKKDTDYVWIDEFRYYDTNGLDGMDGMVYSDRTPQTDFWQMRKVYAPIQIKERSATVKPGQQNIGLTVENRYDFRSLNGMRLVWSLKQNGAEIQKGVTPLNIPSRESGKIEIGLNIPSNAANDFLTLEIRCLDEAGSQINERVVRLDFGVNTGRTWLNDLAANNTPSIKESDTEIRVSSENWDLAVVRSTGTLTIGDKAGRNLLDGIYPHASRKHSVSEKLRAKNAGTWVSPTLTKVDSPVVKVEQSGSSVRLSVAGRYPRPDALEQSFVGGFTAEITANGEILISYNYVPTDAKGTFTEAGLSFVVPAQMTEFRWIGEGIYAGYPGKDRLNEFGIFHLNRSDLRFPGNRRETELSLLTTPTGDGIAVENKAADISVDRVGDQTILSHNAVISGVGNKGTAPETNIDAAKTKSIAGKLKLVPLDTNWTPHLIRLFGKPRAASGVFQPFYHSYDQ